MNNNPIDVSFKDVNKKYYTIDEVSNILSIDQSKIIFYFEKLNDFLNIASVGMYQLFDDKDIENLKIIKNFDIDKKMTIKDIKEYLSKNKQEVMLEKEPNNKLDESVLNIFQKFANALMEQNVKIEEMHKTNIKLVEAINILSQNQGNIQLELHEQKKLNQELLEKYEIDKNKQYTQLNSIQNDIAITKDIDKKLEEQKNQIENNFNNMSRKIIDENKKELEEFKKDIKYISQEEIQKYKEKNQNQGFLSNITKIFHKKN